MSANLKNEVRKRKGEKYNLDLHTGTDYLQPGKTIVRRRLSDHECTRSLVQID